MTEVSAPYGVAAATLVLALGLGILALGLGRWIAPARRLPADIPLAPSFPAQVTMEGPALRGRATLTFKQSSFGYKPYSAVLGAIKNKDEVVLHIDLVATP